MDTWIALLRAVNVSGVNRFPMDEFRDMLMRLGPLSARIADGVPKRFGFRPPLILLGAAQIDGMLAANPFPEAASTLTQLHAFFMDRAMPVAGLSFLNALAVPGVKARAAGARTVAAPAGRHRPVETGETDIGAARRHRRAQSAVSAGDRRAGEDAGLIRC